MAIVKDIKELPKNEQKLKKYTIYTLLICLLASIGFTALYLQRMTDANSEKPKKPKILVSTAHFLGYLALAVVTCLALYGTFYKKEKFLIWFSIGGLLLVIGEILCLIWGLFMNCKN
jgi:VanZ family protein